MITIKFNPAHLKRWKRAVSRVSATAIIETNEQPRRNAVKFSYFLRDALIKQRYANKYRPLKPYYVKQKIREGASTDFWRYSDDLFSNITTFMYSSGNKSTWAAGIIPGTPNSKDESITIYGLRMEYGADDKDQPARPLFGPATEDYRKSDFLLECNRSLKKMKREWR